MRDAINTVIEFTVTWEVLEISQHHREFNPHLFVRGSNVSFLVANEEE